MVESSKKNDDGQKDNSKLVIGFIIIIIIILIVVLIIVFAVSKKSSNKKEAAKDDFSERTCNSQAFKERSFPAVKFDNIGYFTRKYVKQYPGPLVLEDYHGQGYTSYVAKHDDNDNEDSVVYVDETQAQELIAAKGYRKIVSQSYPNSHLDTRDEVVDMYGCQYCPKLSYTLDTALCAQGRTISDGSRVAFGDSTLRDPSSGSVTTGKYVYINELNQLLEYGVDAHQPHIFDKSGYYNNRHLKEGEEFEIGDLEKAVFDAVVDKQNHGRDLLIVHHQPDEDYNRGKLLYYVKFAKYKPNSLTMFFKLPDGGDLLVSRGFKKINITTTTTRSDALPKKPKSSDSELGFGYLHKNVPEWVRSKFATHPGPALMKGNYQGHGGDEEFFIRDSKDSKIYIVYNLYPEHVNAYKTKGYKIFKMW